MKKIGIHPPAKIEDSGFFLFFFLCFVVFFLPNFRRHFGMTDQKHRIRMYKILLEVPGVGRQSKEIISIQSI